MDGLILARINMVVRAVGHHHYTPSKPVISRMILSTRHWPIRRCKHSNMPMVISFQCLSSYSIYILLTLVQLLYLITLVIHFISHWPWFGSNIQIPSTLLTMHFHVSACHVFGFPSFTHLPCFYFSSAVRFTLWTHV